MNPGELFELVDPVARQFGFHTRIGCSGDPTVGPFLTLMYNGRLDLEKLFQLESVLHLGGFRTSTEMFQGDYYIYPPRP